MPTVRTSYCRASLIAGRSTSATVSAACAPTIPPADADSTRRVPVDLVATAHRFRRGHRIRLQISSGAHPRLVRNTGTGARWPLPPNSAPPTKR